MGEFTKGGILSADQLNEIDNNGTWKKGGILSATQLNKLANQQSGGSSSTEQTEIELTILNWDTYDSDVYMTDYPSLASVDKSLDELNNIRQAIIDEDLTAPQIAITVKNQLYSYGTSTVSVINTNESTATLTFFFKGDNYDFLASLILAESYVALTSVPITGGQYRGASVSTNS